MLFVPLLQLLELKYSISALALTKGISPKFSLTIGIFSIGLCVVRKSLKMTSGVKSERKMLHYVLKAFSAGQKY